MSQEVEQDISGTPAPMDGAGEDRAYRETVLEEFVKDEHLEDPATHGLPKLHATHGPLPIIMGVTGHRDLREEDIGSIRQMLHHRYGELRRHYPSTSFVLLSGLADGADRVCSRVALELGLRLIAVLPMPQDLYETDFSAESLEEFRELLGLAEHSFALPILDGHTRESISRRGPERDRQYEQLAAYLATQSQILIAFWDGVHRTLQGGTSQLVRFKLDGVPEPFAPPHSELDAPDSGPVYHVITPRKSNPHPVGQPFSVHRLYPPGFETIAEAQDAQSDVQERMDMFNADALRYSEKLRATMQQSKDYLFPARLHLMLPEMMRETLDFYAIADVLSQRFQKRTHLTLKILLGFIFLAASFSQIYSGPYQDTSMIVLYLAMFVLSSGVYFVAERRGYHVKYLDYRALAEGLRVQFYWKLAGLRDSVADFYMRKQKSELDWIRIAVRSSMAETRPSMVSSAALLMTQKERLEYVLKHWVADQAKYFAKAAHRDQGQLRKISRWSGILFISGLTTAAVQALLEPNNWIQLAMSMFPVGGAILGAYNEKRAISEQSKQFDRMGVLFRRANDHLEKLIADEKLEAAKAFVAELGREALTENGDWIITHRERPLEIPKGA